MKCWRCGKEIDDGAEKCLYCNADQRRSAPATDIGKALRQLYDHYGAEAVLTNSVLLSNGLADVVTDSVSVNIKKIKNQMKMAMEVGLGNLYKEQLTIGQPDAGFVSRVKTLLTEDAGLNEKSAADIMGWFDEMIGWAPEKAKTAAPELKRARLEEKMPAPLPEIEEAKEPETPPPASPEPKKSLTPLWIILAVLICVAGVLLYRNNRRVMDQAVMSTQEALSQLTSVAATQEALSQLTSIAATQEALSQLTSIAATQEGLNKAAKALAATQTKIAEPTATNTPTKTPKPTATKTSTPKPTATKTPTPRPTATPTPSIGIPRITSLNQEGGKINISWTKVAGAAYYELFSSKNNYSYIKKRITKDFSATIIPSEDSGTFYYKIRACSDNICGDFSPANYLNYQKPTSTPRPIATQAPAGVKVGDIITFGSYEQDKFSGPDPIEWQVLTLENGRALLLSRYGLVREPYHKTYVDITWENSDLRTWLNGTFYSSAFTSSEKARIQEVWNTNPDNPDNGTEGGNDTKDKIFLLSIDEAGKYLTSDSARRCQVTYIAKQNGAYVDENGNSDWWLRSPGNFSTFAARVDYTGYVDYFGWNIVRNDYNMVRPALWLIL